MSLKNKKILITAGPTWVSIDTVRVISNTATGATGILLAEKLRKLDAKVTLLLGPVPNVVFLRSVSSGSRAEVSASRRDTSTSNYIRERDTEAKTTLGIETCCLNKKIKLIHFRFFDELRRIIIKELTTKKYDIVIQTAAVADYRPQRSFKQKVKSGIKQWRLNLIPIPKIIDSIKKIDNNLFLVGFKFESKVPPKILIDKARSLMNGAKLDLVVANTISKDRYLAYIVNQNKIIGPLENKDALADKLINLIGETVWRS